MLLALILKHEIGLADLGDGSLDRTDFELVAGMELRAILAVGRTCSQTSPMPPISSTAVSTVNLAWSNGQRTRTGIDHRRQWISYVHDHLDWPRRLRRKPIIDGLEAKTRISQASAASS